MTVLEHVHDSKPSGGRLREFLDWSFRAPQADKRYARSALVIWSLVSFAAALLFLAINLL